MPADITFHYPPELFQLMVDAVPRLCRSKTDLMLFLQGAGIGEDILRDHWQVVRTDPKSVSKFQITRYVLQRLNERGERTLQERRELLRRVVEFENFSACWENERAAAKGYVADIRNIVEVKDSFTRMRQEKDRERREHMKQQEARVAALRKQKAAQEQVRQKLYGLFKEDLDPHQRGRDFEAVLNELFQLDGILLRDSFRRQGQQGQTLEQIDGAVEIAGQLYLVEAKWHKQPIGVQDVQVLISRLFLRPGAPRGIFISASGFSGPAINAQQEAASQKILLLCDLSEIVQILDREEDIGRFFKRKADQAITAVSSE
jgi:restriction system protein